ncbi:MAG: peptidoglycan DD-metalloendopeptidase family protein [Parvularcula sp.]|jgi:hypothetical protein|nr:peptidoglycan DD-metalloendopeptidase family protein [Parvularcula sp.]
MKTVVSMLMAYLLLAVGLPVVLSGLVIFARWPFAIPLLCLMALAITGIGYSFFSTPWSVYSYWSLVPLVGAGTIALAAGAFKLTRASWSWPGLIRSAASVVFLLGSAYFASFLVAAVGAMQKPKESLALAFPLKDGVFAVVQGGAAPPLQNKNGHASSPAQIYALDVVKLSSAGHTMPGFLQAKPGGPSAGIGVYAPCGGEVVWSRDGLPDSAERNREQPAGNVVAISCQGVIVSLGHLENGSVLVAEGNSVEVGELIGRVGNSASSGLHHLHFHAERGELQGDFSDNPGVAMTFDGRFLWQGALIVK